MQREIIIISCIDLLLNDRRLSLTLQAVVQAPNHSQVSFQEASITLILARSKIFFRKKVHVYASNNFLH